MKYLPVTIRLRRGRRRGSVLVMAIVIITLLFMVGSTFLLTSRTTKQTVAAIDSVSSIDDGIDAVINRINTVLVEDLLGKNDLIMNPVPTMLNSSSTNLDSDEYWDYPYTNPTSAGTDDDMWLASMVPMKDSVAGIYYWPHVTDLYYSPSYGPFGYYELVNLGMTPSVQCYSPGSSGTWDGSPGSSYYRIDFTNNHNQPTNYNIARVIQDNQSTEIIIENGNWANTQTDVGLWGAQADADGDGISDSYWVKIPEITGPDGKNLYAAVRIIDNCGMINVNTAYLNSTDPDPLIGTKGANLSDVSLEGMSPPSFTNPIKSTNYLHAYRVQLDSSLMPPPTTPYLHGSSSDPNNREEIYYYDNSILSFLDHRRLASVIPIDNLATDHFPLPFDLSDEIELRNRFCLDSPTVIPLESLKSSNPTGSDGIWTITQRATPFYELDPLNIGANSVTGWYENISWNNPANDVYYRRHMLTAYSWDRTMRGYVFTAGAVTPAPVAGFADPSTGAAPITLENLQANINNTTTTAGQIATALIYAYGASFGNTIERQTVAQLACNIVDYRDKDMGTGDPPSYLYYASTGSPGSQDKHVIGNEAHPFIRQVDVNAAADPTGAGNPYVFTVTFTNPYGTDIANSELSGYELHLYNAGAIVGTPIPLTFTSAPMTKNNGTIEPLGPLGTAGAFDNAGVGQYSVEFDTIALVRISNSFKFLIDKWPIPVPALISTPFSATYARVATDLSVVQDYNYDIANKNFATVGEVTRVLTIGPPEITGGSLGTLQTVGEQLIAGAGVITTGRLDITTAADQELLSRLTVLSRIGDTFDNNGDGTTDDRGELAMPGRININTAPQKVLEALPWVLDSALPVADREKLAQAIIAYRDNLDIPSGPQYKTNGRVVETGIAGVNPGPGFKYPAELINVTWTGSVGPDFPYDIRRQSKNATDLTGMPDTSPGDGAGNDLEERDVIFHRMSNLVTVRSDTFTAYIMVRLGEVGPQKRVIAIFDRSGVFTKNDVPRLVALHPVPDPR